MKLNGKRARTNEFGNDKQASCTDGLANRSWNGDYKMKMSDVIIVEKQEKGTYAGARFDSETNKAIHKYMSDNKIPNAIRPDKLHITILYSRKPCPEYEALGKLETPWIAKPKEFVVWKTNGEDDNEPSNCLVLKLDCPDIVKRHKDLMKEHDATFDHADFSPHVTLSYSIGDIEIKDLPNISDSISELKVVEEYGEDLDLNWAKNKGTKKGS